MYSIEVEELYKSYDKTPFKKKVINILKFKSPESERVEALKGISFKVRKGEVFGFLGPNGAGKTTTVKILTTILKPDSGYASILGFDVVKESLEVRKRIGVLPEESSRGFYWRLTVYESLYFYALEYGVDDPKKRVKEVIEMVGLGEAAYDRWFQRLSQGMKQKAALARALVPDAPVMFLDEPTRGLDVIFYSKLKEMIKNRFGRKDRTIFLCSHDVHFIEETCDRIALINKGEIIAIKDVEDFEQSFQSLGSWIYNLEVTGDNIDILARRISDLNGVERTDVKNNSTLEIVINRDKVNLTTNQILRIALEEGFTVLSFKRREMNLEEIILRILGGEQDVN